MIYPFAERRLLLLLGLGLLGLNPAQSFARNDSPAPLVADTSLHSTNVFHAVQPGPYDGQIALVTARMLERFHYLREPFNDTVSSNFLDRYVETFDPQRLHFLQSDLAEFEPYRTNLDHLTLPERGVAPDTHPAFVIFNRFVKRLEQRVAYVDDLLQHETFTFDTDERVVLNRKDLPFPKDLNEAKQLWRERLRAEYLQEKLGRMDEKKKAATQAAHTNNVETAKAPKTPAQEIVETLSHRYHRNLRTCMDWDHEDVLQFYLTALAHVYDPHSDYFNGSTLASFAIAMNLSLFGIGAELTSEDGYCTIHRLLAGGPAEKSKKIKENDRIVAVAQSNQPPVDVVDMSLSRAVQLIRGPKGTQVTLTIIPAGADASARQTLTLVRDEIKLEDQEAKAKLIELPGPTGAKMRLGVIDLPSFYASFDPSNARGHTEKSTTADVLRLINKLKEQEINGLVLDLRRNGGGSLEEAIKLTGLFIKEGPVVQVRGFDGSIEQNDDLDPTVAYDGPMIVLTSRFSASASEILAGALQDYGRALIVGDSSTHGKGTVQSVQNLKDFMRVRGMTNDPGALKVTIKKFYRASGASTQLKGVVPDIILPSVLSASKDVGERALENPLDWDTIPSAKYDHLNLVEPYLPELRKRSTQRLTTDKDYAYIREDINQFKKQQADKTVSLNEKQRLAEKEQADARAKARNAERLARIEPPEQVYELTLKQAALPGLPPPMAKTNAIVAKVSGAKGQIPSVATLGTNVTVAAKEPAADSSNSLDDALDEEKPPAVDAALNETERILLDYASLVPNGHLITEVRP